MTRFFEPSVMQLQISFALGDNIFECPNYLGQNNLQCQSRPVNVVIYNLR